MARRKRRKKKRKRPQKNPNHPTGLYGANTTRIPGTDEARTTFVTNWLGFCRTCGSLAHSDAFGARTATCSGCNVTFDVMELDMPEHVRRMVLGKGKALEEEGWGFPSSSYP